MLFLSIKINSKVQALDKAFGNVVSKSKIEMKAAKIMAIIMSLFLLSWLPYLAFNVDYKTRENNKRFVNKWIFTALQISKIFIFSNSFLNPIIYFWLLYDFRKAVRNIFYRFMCFRRKK